MEEKEAKEEGPEVRPEICLVYTSVLCTPIVTLAPCTPYSPTYFPHNTATPKTLQPEKKIKPAKPAETFTRKNNTPTEQGAGWLKFGFLRTSGKETRKIPSGRDRRLAD
ncbi:hypothetical protein CISG_08967 [Coccidioides immitis RMSCC 3703]|uniref:Uncharacterized protein n=1 Tax=Coccidioides immitis RMSCC 3703 TaxID=454286 RepID=A0A0J8U2H0_COCIT|nr:hypothetical protein CISG_08967 [Coccidioides immitis RMSCC 3703]